MSENLEKPIDIVVIKRDGKKVEFNGTKIAIAIKKGFDSVKYESDLDHNYTEKDIFDVYHLVIDKIRESGKDKIKIEEIQDLIEDCLKAKGYNDIYESFSSYRERRNQSRQLFFDEKKQHKFLKAIENLSLNTPSGDDMPDTTMGTMLKYGQTVSKEYSISYLLKRKFADAHESGDIFIHDLDYLPMGTSTCCHIDLNKLFDEGFSTGYGFLREPNNIMTYSILTAIIIQANQNDQHGGQSIPAIDYYFSPGVVKTFKKEFRQTVYDFLDYTDFGIFAAVNGMEREIEKLTTIDFDISIFDNYCRESEQLKRLFRIAYDKALKKTDRIVYQAMDALIHNLNTMRSRAGSDLPDSTISLGTDTSKEGRMITENFLKALDAGIGNNENPLYPTTIFKVKEGINYNENDKNYDLFKLACKVDSSKLLINFAFLDTNFNNKNYNSNDFNTEIAYMGNGIRVFENIVDETKEVSMSRGNLSITTINLPRIGIKHGILNNKKPNMKEFFNELDEKLELIKEQLIDRYESQSNKRVYNFPILIGQGIWMDSEKLKPTDRLRRVNKHGTVSIGIVGLAECLKALTGKHHGEDEESQKLGLKIVKHIRDKSDEYSEKYHMNFNIYAVQDKEVLENLIHLDKAIYGKIKDVTDKDSYTKGIDLPEHYNVSISDKINTESKYHSLTNGGHMITIDLGNKSKNNPELFEKTVRMMKEAEIGYGKIIIK